MPSWTRFIVPILLIGVAIYLYQSNYFVKIGAVFELVPTHVSVRATGGSYQDCKVILTGGFRSSSFDIRVNETIVVPIHDFRQWNGTLLESLKLLQPEVEIDLQCDEGHATTTVHNSYSESE